MRLTDEDVRRHKENKYSVECVKGKVKMSDGDIIGNLCDTIEALQQEYDELDTGHSKLFKAYCALQERNGAMRQQLEIIKANIHEFPPEGMTIGKQIWIETTDKSLSSDAPTDYHNPADVEALKQARATLQILNNLGGLGYDKHHWIRETLAAIDKVVGE